MSWLGPLLALSFVLGVGFAAGETRGYVRGRKNPVVKEVPAPCPYCHNPITGETDIDLLNHLGCIQKGQPVLASAQKMLEAKESEAAEAVGRWQARMGECATREDAIKRQNAKVAKAARDLAAEEDRLNERERALALREGTLAAKTTYRITLQRKQPPNGSYYNWYLYVAENGHLEQLWDRSVNGWHNHKEAREEAEKAIQRHQRGELPKGMDDYEVKKA